MLASSLFCAYETRQAGCRRSVVHAATAVGSYPCYPGKRPYYLNLALIHYYHYYYLSCDRTDAQKYLCDREGTTYNNSSQLDLKSCFVGYLPTVQNVNIIVVVPSSRLCANNVPAAHSFAFKNNVLIVCVINITANFACIYTAVPGIQVQQYLYACACITS